MDSTETKQCCICGETKPQDAFKPGKNGCRECHKTRRCQRCGKTRRRSHFAPDPLGTDYRSALRSLTCDTCSAPKKCLSCGRDYPLYTFTKSAKSVDGRSWYCRVCIEASHKECARCHQYQFKNQFPADRTSDDGRAAICKSCKARSDERDRRQDVEQGIAAQMEELRIEQQEARSLESLRLGVGMTRTKPESSFRRSLQESLGLSSTDVKDIRERLAQEQNNRCAVCTLPFGKTYPAKLDHCHTTNTIRGVLCNNCNMMLGFGRDNPEVLRRGADYVASYQKSSENDESRPIRSDDSLVSSKV